MKFGELSVGLFFGPKSAEGCVFVKTELSCGEVGEGNATLTQGFFREDREGVCDLLPIGGRVLFKDTDEVVPC